PAVDGGEPRAQHVVPLEHRLQAALEHANVERAANAEGDRHVVERVVRLELIEEPEALLRERQRQCGGGGGAAGGVGGRRGGGAVGGGRLDGGRLDQRLKRQIDRQRLAHPRHHLRGEQRVAADVEEAVTDVDVRQSQHRREDRRQRRLDVVARAAEIG